MFAAVEHDLVDETPQQGLTLSIGGDWVGPDLRVTACEADDLALKPFAYPHLNDRLGRGLLHKRFFGRSNLVQRSLPATLKFGGDKTIIGVHPIELTLGQSGGARVGVRRSRAVRRPPGVGSGEPLTAHRARPAPVLSGTHPPLPCRSVRHAFPGRLSTRMTLATVRNFRNVSNTSSKRS